MVPSTFPVKPGEFRLLKRLHGLPPDAEALPNFTVICLALRFISGTLGVPLSERGLCLALLALQAASCALALGLRYSPLALYLFDG